MLSMSAKEKDNLSFPKDIISTKATADLSKRTIVDSTKNTIKNKGEAS